jgi:dsRNA-specific ribonuclease
MSVARDFVVFHLMPSLRELWENEAYAACFGSDFNPVSKAHEMAMKVYREFPEWVLIDQHEKYWFKVAAQVRGKTLVEGEGSNMAQARRDAAEKLIDKLATKA